MAERKKQHYIPQFYFKLFSKDGKNIEIYNLLRKKHFTGSIDGQCSKPYFYSKDLRFEKGYELYENHLSTIIKKIIDSNSLISLGGFEIINSKNLNEYIQRILEKGNVNDKSIIQDFEYPDILTFIAFQNARTKKTKEEITKISKLLIEGPLLNSLKNHPGIKAMGLSTEELNALQFSIPNIHLFAMLPAFLSGILLCDLIPILLVNKTNEDFIFSDCPVVLHNSYFNHLKNATTTGYQNHGLQIFYPLNSKFMLMLIDSETYIINHTEYKVDLFNIDDVVQINSLNYFHCKNCIYYSTPEQSKSITNLHSKLSSLLNKQDMIKVRRTEVRNGNQHEVEVFIKPNINFDLILTFIKSKDNINIPFYPRNMQLVKSFKEAYMNSQKKRK
jgi:hypothetical protein